MLFTGRCYHDKVESYSSYKKRKFNERREKLRLLLNGISELSLKAADKEKLLEEMKKQVNNFTF